MNQPINEEILSAYLDGELDDAQRADVEAALEQDEQLRAQFVSLQDIHESWQALPSYAAPKDSVARLMSRIESEITDSSPTVTIQKSLARDTRSSGHRQWISLALTATAASALTALFFFIGNDQTAVTLIHETEQHAGSMAEESMEAASKDAQSANVSDGTPAGGEMMGGGMGGMGGGMGGAMPGGMGGGGMGGLSARANPNTADEGEGAGAGFGAALNQAEPFPGIAESNSNAIELQQAENLAAQIVRVQCSYDQLQQLGDLLAKNDLTLINSTIREEFAQQNGVAEDSEGEYQAPSQRKQKAQLLNNYDRQASDVKRLNAKNNQVVVMPYQVVEGSEQQVAQLLEDLDATKDVAVAVTTSFYQQSPSVQRSRVVASSDAADPADDESNVADKPAVAIESPNQRPAEAADEDGGQAKKRFADSAPARAKLIILLDVR